MNKRSLPLSPVTGWLNNWVESSWWWTTCTTRTSSCATTPCWPCRSWWSTTGTNSSVASSRRSAVRFLSFHVEQLRRGGDRRLHLHTDDWRPPARAPPYVPSFIPADYAPLSVETWWRSQKVSGDLCWLGWGGLTALNCTFTDGWFMILPGRVKEYVEILHTPVVVSFVLTGKCVVEMEIFSSRTSTKEFSVLEMQQRK